MAFALALWSFASSSTRSIRRANRGAWHAEVLEQRQLLTFGVNGVAVADVTAGQGDWVEGTALQADGKIVAAGNVGVARFESDGSLDTSFNPGGSLPGFVRNSAAYFNDVAVQADGRIVVVGRTYRGNDDFLVHRYLSNGALDPTFGTNGVVITDLAKGKTDEAKEVAIQADGKIVVVGYSGDSWANAAKWTVVRYNANGTLDKTFNRSGIVAGFGKGSSAESAESVVIQSNGRILVGGYVGGGSPDFALARYNLDGTLDRTFGGTGKVQTDFASEHGGGTSSDFAYAIATGPDGRIVAVGRTSNGKVALARYLASGALDTSFAGDGKLAPDVSPVYRFKSVAVQQDHKIVAAGGDSFFVAARYNVDGSLDTSFSAGVVGIDDRDGWFMLPVGSSWGNDVLLQADGKIVLGGGGGADENTDFVLIRLNADGSLDEEAPAVVEAATASGGESLGSAALIAAGDDEEEALLAVLSDFDAELLT